MLNIRENVLEKRKWYSNPMTQVYNQKILNNQNLSDSEKINLSIKALLEAKGLNDATEQNDFFNPDFAQMNDPFLFKDMYLACEIISETIKAKEKILIYGDYDCDGLTSTAIMLRVLKTLGGDVDYFIPDRLEDGYGLSSGTVDQVLKLQPDLIITVDCGINSVAEVDTLMQANVKVIVSDHHQPAEHYAKNALAVINPQVKEDNYPFAELAGAGVAFKLSQALIEYMQIEDLDLAFALCLAAVGTTADSMPLEKENRSIVSLATAIFNEKAPLGLRLLAEKFNGNKMIDSSFFSFVIGPRLNAAGRMGKLTPAVNLLLNDDINSAEKAIEELEELNNQRKELEHKIYEEAIYKIGQMPTSEKENIILVADENWHSGITGIVSSRLMEKFSVPVITFAGCDDVLKGSGRSFGNFDILAAIRSAKEYTITFGGHLQAAGVTISYENYEAFKQIILDYAAANPINKSEIKDKQYLLELPHDLINENFVNELSRFEPFGQKNEKPIFVLKNVYIEQWREVGQGKHISLNLRLNDSRIVSAIAFHAQEFSRLFKRNDYVDLLVYLNLQEWNGKTSIQLQVLDWAISSLKNLLWDDAERVEKTYQVDPSNIVNLEKMYGFNHMQFSVNNDQIINVTKYIYQYSADLNKGINISILARAIVREMKIFLNPFILQRILYMLKEASVLDWQTIDSNNISINILPKEQTEKSIQKTQTWKNLNQQGYML